MTRRGGNRRGRTWVRIAAKVVGGGGNCNHVSAECAPGSWWRLLAAGLAGFACVAEKGRRDFASRISPAEAVHYIANRS